MSNSANPLKQFFRQPAIYLRLPSNGEFWPENTLDADPQQEIPVYPMTAIDEITYRTPDALYNGSAVVSVVQSCIPAIRNAWAMPAIDLNAVLISIRIASSGHGLDVTSRCPNCGHEEDYTADLRTMLAALKSADFATQMEVNGVEVFFRPMTFEEQNNINVRQFEQQRNIVMLNSNTEIPQEQKMNLMQATLLELTQITSQALSYSIAAVRTPGAVVTEREFILEWINNCDRTVFERLRDHVINLRESTDIQPMHLECPECKHQYQQSVVLDSSSFFGAAS